MIVELIVLISKGLFINYVIQSAGTGGKPKDDREMGGGLVRDDR